VSPIFLTQSLSQCRRHGVGGSGSIVAQAIGAIYGGANMMEPWRRSLNHGGGTEVC